MPASAADAPGEGVSANGGASDLLTPSEALRLSPVEAEAVRAALRAELPATGYDGPRPGWGAFRGATTSDNERALMCLTQAVYYEAANESESGQRAVAQVVLNRVRHPDYPSSVCGVVYQGSERATGCQFTFTCDGALARSPMQSKWSRARRIAREALGGRAFGEVGYATHYHTFEVWPYWGRTLTMTNMIGRHIFHRLRGRGGSPAYFTERYSGRESGPRPWRPRPAQDTADNALAEVVAAASRAAEVQAAQEPNNLSPAPVARNEASRTTTTPRVREPNNLPDSGVREDALPDSQIRPEFRESGRWIGG
ncbi:MAG: cell wall hydrolase [Sphingomonadaceae bacterium]|nr:cell wall hydrolase [Sphingomonadaceae bacterium]